MIAVPSGYASLGELLDFVEKEVLGDELDKPIRTKSYSHVIIRVLEYLETGKFVAYTVDPTSGDMHGIDRKYWRTVFGKPALHEGLKCYDLEGKTGLPFVIKIPAGMQLNFGAASREISSGNTWKSKGGRPREHDWDGAFIEMARVAISGQDHSPAALTRAVTEWFAKTYDREPADSQIREQVARFHDALWPPKTS
ncbi:hypothetical protein MKK69_20380 [Methylobacterium sp. J-026]|uniref:hypothetical protein n=1 Tax=Methylobacterium sp. J-026 TaxID=2836624 RepID=UPI001FBA272D|nr:hypothetical protein [Methylobacterium sp. J-026]MCJ2136377.1 hypothetical protein [Methylobacterium sp. J-026]